jgi:hypothetical protein
MEEASAAIEPVVIKQDDSSEIHLQTATQSGARQIDVRVWRRGPAGFAPSRNALTVAPADLGAVRDGVKRLLQESSGGTQAVRIVLEKEDGRRLRAETEPFGTKYLAKLVFWQRVRDSWRPVDDGLIVIADQLEPMLEKIEGFAGWLGTEDDAADGHQEPLQHHTSHPWPNPGSDWITIDPGKIVFHPRGIRISCVVEEREGRHFLTLRQWKRDETLWVPEECRLELDMVQLDATLSRIREIERGSAEESLEPEDEATIRVALQAGNLVIEASLEEGQTPPCTLSTPLAETARLGRALLQAGSMLARSLTPDERARLEEMKEASPAVAKYEAEVPATDLRPTKPPPGSTSGYPSIRDMILSTLATPISSSRERGEATATGVRKERERLVDEVDEEVADEEEEDVFFELEPGYMPVQEIQLDHHRVHISVRPGEDGRLSLQWSGKSIGLPVDRLAELISDLRDLYYDSLRGRRGRPITVETQPPVTISVLHHGTQLYFALAQETEGNGTHLSFPASEVPIFLDAARAALGTLQGAARG